MKNIKTLIFTFVFLVSLCSVKESYAIKGNWLNVDLTYGIVDASVTSSVANTVSNGDLLGVTISYNGGGIFNLESFRLLFGVGLEAYDFTITYSTGETWKISNTILTIPVTARLYPMPWFVDNPSFEFYLGVGAEAQISMSGSVTSSVSGKQTGSWKTGIGLLMELGVHYKFAESWLVAAGGEYNIALSNINSGANTNTYKPSFLKFNLGVGYKF